MSQGHGRAGSIIGGILLIVAGVGFAGNIFFNWHFDIFFEGWWTLFIIVPCIVSIIRHGVQAGNLIGLAAGLLLFLGARDIIDWGFIGRMLVPVVLVVIGLQMIFRRNSDMSSPEEADKKGETAGFGSASAAGAYNAHNNEWIAGDASREEGAKRDGGASESAGAREFRTIFGQRKIVYQGETFSGATVESIFGSVELDLRGAMISGERKLSVTCLLGTVEIWTPENVNVVLHSSPIFGAVSNQKGQPAWMPSEGVLVIDAASTLGSVQIK